MLEIELYQISLPYDRGRSGYEIRGASAAANAGVADRLFQRHGRWKSVSAKNGYVEDSLESRLLVSKNLGI